MKEVLIKSIKTTHKTTIILGIICFCLLVTNVLQVYQSNHTLRKTQERFTDLMLEQQPDIYFNKIFQTEN